MHQEIDLNFKKTLQELVQDTNRTTTIASSKSNTFWKTKTEAQNVQDVDSLARRVPRRPGAIAH